MSTDGWPLVPLTDICSPKQWPTIAQTEFTTKGFPVYGANGQIGYYSEFNHEKPTVLITCRGATCGTINVCAGRSYVTGNSMALDHLDESRVDLRFLVYALRNGSLSKAISGTAQPQITRQGLSAISVPLPALHEQRRIAEILDKVDTLRARRRAALAKLDHLTQAIFLDMFGHPATNPKRWPVVALEDVATTTSGGTPNREVKEYFGGGIPWVKSGELHQGFVTATEESLSERGLAESSAKLMPAGTVLVAMYGATVGAVALLGIEAATNQAICCVSPGRQLNTDYFVQLLRWLSPSLLAKRVGGAQPNLSQELLRKLSLILPPLELQQAFASRLAVTVQVATTNRLLLERLDTLFDSLQYRAFRGDL